MICKNFLMLLTLAAITITLGPQVGLGHAQGESATPPPASRDSHRASQPGAWRDVDWMTLEKGHRGVWARPALVVARNECEWTAAMAELSLLILPAPSPPDVIWSRQTAVLVALGRADGYSVEVRGVSRVGRTLILDVHVELGQRSGEIDVCPYHLIAVDVKSVNTVVARYNWAPPGLPNSATALPCAVGRGRTAAEVSETPLLRGESTGPRPVGTVTWGSLTN